MDTTIEIKVKEEGKTWEDSQVIVKEDNVESTDHADALALFTAKLLKKEVRWNWEGCTQGHYIGTAFKFQ